MAIGKAKESRRRLALADRALKAAELHLQGMPQRAIAAKLGCGVASVNRDLKAVLDHWQAAATDSREAWVAKELGRLGLVEKEAWRGWKRSLKDHEVINTKKTSGGGDTKAEASKRTEGQAGDPQFLRRVLDCVTRRCELLGLNAPQRQEHTGPGGGPIQLTAVQYTDEQLSAIIAGGSQGAIEATACEVESSAVHEIHESTLPGELAP